MTTPAGSGPETLAEAAAACLQAAILAGELGPGAKLGVQQLARRFGIGATPMREGLSRLVAQGFVVAIGQRGFRVAATSAEDLADLQQTRTVIEVEALRLAMARGDDRWEAEIVGQMHRLRSAIQRWTSGDDAECRGYDVVHKAFHTALIGACGSPRLLALHSSLYDQAARYRRVMMGPLRLAGDVEAKHRDLADLVLRRDSEAACAALRTHLAATLAIAYPGDAPGAAPIREGPDHAASGDAAGIDSRARGRRRDGGRDQDQARLHGRQ